MHNLNQYINKADTTQRQRELAVNEREKLTDFVCDKSQQALSEIKNLHYTSERKAHIAALQGVLTEFVENNSPTIEKNQQQALQSSQKDITDYRNEINRSHSYGFGR